MSFNPYSSPQGKDPTLPVKLAAKMYTSSTPHPPLSQINSEAATRPIAIVQPAKHNCAWWGQYLKGLAGNLDHSAVEYRKGVAAFKESRVWEEEGYTWTEASKLFLLVTPQTSNRLIRELTENYCEESEPPRSATLQKVVQLPTPPREEEPEKPQVRTADEVIAANAEEKKDAASPPMDASGCIVPQSLLAHDLRDRIKEVTEAAYWASKLKCLFEKMQSDNDPLFAHAKDTGSVQTFMTGAARMHHALAECSPDIVCPECGGTKKTCHYCCGTGWISQSRWHQDWEKSSDRLKQAEVHRRATIKAKYD